jgi:hypothetical protein
MDSLRTKCGLCGHDSSRIFSKKILFKYDVIYYKCDGCLSVYTEKPYWLAEAYSDSNLNLLDTGAVQRNLHNQAFCFVISKLFSVGNYLDYGGGDGLLCRLLRDLNINCYVEDMYAKPVYSIGYTSPNYVTPDVLMAFEVVEHFSNPDEEINNLFKYNSKITIISTCFYEGQGVNWDYLSSETGQHVFFYTKKSFLYLANKYRREVIFIGNYAIFIKDNINFMAVILMKIFLSPKIIRLVRSLIQLIPNRASKIDHDIMKIISKKQ